MDSEQKINNEQPIDSEQPIKSMATRKAFLLGLLIGSLLLGIFIFISEFILT